MIGSCHAPCRGGEHLDRYADAVEEARLWLEQPAGGAPARHLDERMRRLSGRASLRGGRRRARPARRASHRRPRDRADAARPRPPRRAPRPRHRRPLRAGVRVRRRPGRRPPPASAGRRRPARGRAAPGGAGARARRAIRAVLADGRRAGPDRHRRPSSGPAASSARWRSTPRPARRRHPGSSGCAGRYPYGRELRRPPRGSGRAHGQHHLHRSRPSHRAPAAGAHRRPSPRPGRPGAGLRALLHGRDRRRRRTRRGREAPGRLLRGAGRARAHGARAGLRPRPRRRPARDRRRQARRHRLDGRGLRPGVDLPPRRRAADRRRDDREPVPGRRLARAVLRRLPRRRRSLRPRPHVESRQHRPPGGRAGRRPPRVGANRRADRRLGRARSWASRGSRPSARSSARPGPRPSPGPAT